MLKKILPQYTFGAQLKIRYDDFDNGNFDDPRPAKLKKLHQRFAPLFDVVGKPEDEVEIYNWDYYGAAARVKMGGKTKTLLRFFLLPEGALPIEPWSWFISRTLRWAKYMDKIRDTKGF